MDADADADADADIADNFADNDDAAVYANSDADAEAHQKLHASERTIVHGKFCSKWHLTGGKINEIQANQQILQLCHEYTKYNEHITRSMHMNWVNMGHLWGK